MKHTLITAILFGMLGSSAALATGQCNAPVSDWQPREALQKKLEDAGWQVRRIKAEDGCYEVYAVNDKGGRLEAAYDPKTFEVTNLERGGN